MTIIEYGKLYTQFLKQDIPLDKESELMVARIDFVKRGKEALIVAIEKSIEYGNFTNSVLLKDFIARTKWLLIEPDLKKWNDWVNNIPSELYARDNKHCFENAISAVLTLYVCEYINSVYETLR